MLLDFGFTTVKENWIVDEKEPVGYCRVYYVQRGKAHYSTEEESMDLVPSYAYILPSSIPYKVSKNKEDVFVCTYLHISLPLYIIDKAVIINTEENRLLKLYLDLINESICCSNLNLLYCLCDMLNITYENEAGVRRINPELDNILMYINSNLNSTLDTTELSKIAGYNPNYFIKIFKEAVGLSPHQYIIHKRLQKAVRLLKEDHPVAYVAQEVGYDDLSMFSKAFRQKYRMSPNEYKIKGFST
ncbi:MAG: AraC family transcriptional regulator [Clostridia bacterium]|nr:AraC family transcriptional regulator [Clostridia bacterium]